MNSPPDEQRIKNQVKAATDLAEVVREHGVTLRAQGRQLVGLCPFHEEQTPSFLVDPEKQLYKCFGCDAGGDVFNFIQTLEHVSFPEALAKLTAKAGISLTGEGARVPCLEPRRARNSPAGDRQRRTAKAMRVWRAAIPAAGTPVQTYLQSRAIDIALPHTIRLRRLKHRSGGIFPVMVALVTSSTDDTPRGIHRTFLARDGKGKAAVEPQRMMLGPCRGGAVRLAPLDDGLMVGEGIETCLSVMQITGRPAWAALSTYGLRTLNLPKGVREVTVLADGDDPGEAAAQEVARRWKRQGRRVRIARPPRGLDFNDMLLDHVRSLAEAVQ